MINSWLVLLPTILVLISAFTIKKLHISLSLGILSAALIFCDFNILKSATVIAQRFYETITKMDTILIFGFLLTIGAIVTLISVTGGAAAFARKVTKKLQDARAAETSSLFLSSALFIDDYLSNLTVGYVMRPITDRFKIPRAKLAFLVHTLTGPLIVLAPVTSWSAWITAQIIAGGISNSGNTVVADPFYVYLKTIPFIFYSLTMLFSIWFIVRKRISFGTMSNHEEIALTTGNLLGGKKDEYVIEKKVNQNGSLVDLIFPIALLISLIFIFMLYGGGYHIFGGDKSLFEALRSNPDPFWTLFISGSITLSSSIISAVLRKKLYANEIISILTGGAKIMYEPIIMLLLAMTLGLIVKEDLQAGYYLADIATGVFSIKLLPFMLFIIATISGLATGTSWGVMTLLMPITIQMIAKLSGYPLPTTLEHMNILFPSLGAILSGAVCGDHISPISETTIMASLSSGTNPIDHTTTQFPYAIPAIVCSAIAFLLAGLLSDYPTWINILASATTGLVTCAILLVILNRKKKKH